MSAPPPSPGLPPLNPYVAGPSVGGSAAFVGRADVMQAVEEALQRPRESIILHGQRRIGKTSILQQLNRWLGQNGVHRPVDFDLQNMAQKSVDEILRTLAERLVDMLPELTNASLPSLARRTQETFRHKWLPAVLALLPPTQSLVLLFDEFDVIAENPPDPRVTQERPGNPSAGNTSTAGFYRYLVELLSADLPRLRFIFVIGRNVEDLETIAKAVFKQTLSIPVSLLKKQDCHALARRSEVNGSMHWQPDALERLWDLTSGHPYLTQQLCSCIWTELHRKKQPDPPAVTPDQVNAQILKALELSNGAMGWLWDGLPAAARLLASLLAEAGPGHHPEQEVERRLKAGGVRVFLPELKAAPEILRTWDLISSQQVAADRSVTTATGNTRLSGPAETHGFRVELLRQWIAQYHPSRREQKELDRLNPLAERFSQLADVFYADGETDQALHYLHKALEKNRNHIKANELMAVLLLSQKQFDAAIEKLEHLHQHFPAIAAPRLVQALLEKADASPVETSEAQELLLKLVKRVRAIDEHNTQAIEHTARIWKQRGQAAHKRGQLQEALLAYQNAGSAAEIAAIQTELRRLAQAKDLSRLQRLEAEKSFEAALALAQQLAHQQPAEPLWIATRLRLQNRVDARACYDQARNLNPDTDRLIAFKLLLKALTLDPELDEALELLLELKTGTTLHKALEEARQAHQRELARTREAAAPRLGKTSLLHYLAAPQAEEALGLQARADFSLLFQYVSCQQVLGATPEELWRLALTPLSEPDAIPAETAPGATGSALEPTSDPVFRSQGLPPWRASALRRSTELCEQEHFSPRSLNRLTQTLLTHRVRLVLLVDELDALLNAPAFTQAGFLGKLRHFSDIVHGPVTLVLASRLSKVQLLEKTRPFESGSPTFNTFTECHLGPLAPAEVDQVLDQAGTLLTEDDRALVQTLTRGHPRLVQVAGDVLFAQHLAHRSDALLRQQGVEAELQVVADELMAETWETWSVSQRLAFGVVALRELLTDAPDTDHAGMPRPRPPRALVSELKPELTTLWHQGFLGWSSERASPPATPDPSPEEVPERWEDVRIGIRPLLPWMRRFFKEAAAVPDPIRCLEAHGWKDFELGLEVADGLRRLKRSPLRPEPGRVIRLFVSHAPEDASHVQMLADHLQSYVRQGHLHLWYEGSQPLGADRFLEKRTRLATADLILLFVSRHYMASNVHHDEDLPLALSLHTANRATVQPVLVGSVDFTRATFAHLPMLGESTTGQPEPIHSDQGWTACVQRLREIWERRAGR